MAAELYEAGLEAEADTNQVDTFNKRIRNAQIEQWNFILVVGAKEQENGTVAVRTRDTQQHGVLQFKYVKDELMRLHNDKVLDAENDFKVKMTLNNPPGVEYWLTLFDPGAQFSKYKLSFHTGS